MVYEFLKDTQPKMLEIIKEGVKSRGDSDFVYKLVPKMGNLDVDMYEAIRGVVDRAVSSAGFLHDFDIDKSSFESLIVNPVDFNSDDMLLVDKFKDFESIVSSDFLEKRKRFMFDFGDFLKTLQVNYYKPIWAVKLMVSDIEYRDGLMAKKDARVNSLNGEVKKLKETVKVLEKGLYG